MLLDVLKRCQMRLEHAPGDRPSHPHVPERMGRPAATVAEEEWLRLVQTKALGADAATLLLLSLLQHKSPRLGTATALTSAEIVAHAPLGLQGGLWFQAPRRIGRQETAHGTALSAVHQLSSKTSPPR